MQLVKWLKNKTGKVRTGRDNDSFMSWLFDQPLIVFIVEFHNGRQLICRGIGFRYKNIFKNRFIAVAFSCR
jgi:hypothetical protein